MSKQISNRNPIIAGVAMFVIAIFAMFLFLGLGYTNTDEYNTIEQTDVSSEFNEEYGTWIREETFTINTSALILVDEIEGEIDGSYEEVVILLDGTYFYDKRIIDAGFHVIKVITFHDSGLAAKYGGLSYLEIIPNDDFKLYMTWYEETE